MLPVDILSYVINHVLIGEEPTIEDYILLAGTLVSFIAFILWCCFPVHHQDNNATHHFCIYRKPAAQQNPDSYSTAVSGYIDCDFADQQQYLQLFNDYEEADAHLMQPSLMPYNNVGSSTTNFVQNVGDDHAYCT